METFFCIRQEENGELGEALRIGPKDSGLTA